MNFFIIEIENLCGILFVVVFQKNLTWYYDIQTPRLMLDALSVTYAAWPEMAFLKKPV